MKVILESTGIIAEIEVNGQTVPARVWKGVTEKGVHCHAFITRLAIAMEDDSTEFERDLREMGAPKEMSILMRMAL